MKNWLTNNKIYFETLGAISFTAAAIFISWLQYGISKLQYKIEKASLTPILQFKLDIQQNDKGDINTERLTINNEGGFIENFSSDTLTLLTVNHSHEASQIPLETSITLPNYMSTSIVTGNKKDLLETTFSLANFSNIKKLINDSSTEDTGYQQISYGINIYVKVSFDDLLGEHYNKCYSVDRVLGGKEMPEADCLELSDKFIKLSKKGFSITSNKDFTVKKVVSLIKLHEKA